MFDNCKEASPLPECVACFVDAGYFGISFSTSRILSNPHASLLDVECDALPTFWRSLPRPGSPLASCFTATRIIVKSQFLTGCFIMQRCPGLVERQSWPRNDYGPQCIKVTRPANQKRRIDIARIIMRATVIRRRQPFISSRVLRMTVSIITYLFPSSFSSHIFKLMYYGIIRIFYSLLFELLIIYFLNQSSISLYTHSHIFIVTTKQRILHYLSMLKLALTKLV